jgi:predicted dehydrogenase
VLVEKPLALNAAECDAMGAAAATGNAVLAAGQILRALAAMRWTRAAIADGLIGPVRSFDVRVGYTHGWPPMSDFYFRRETGGGVLLDLGAHVLDLLLWWLGDVESFTSHSRPAHAGLWS